MPRKNKKSQTNPTRHLGAEEDRSLRISPQAIIISAAVLGVAVTILNIFFQ